MCLSPLKVISDNYSPWNEQSQEETDHLKKKLFDVFTLPHLHPPWFVTYSNVLQLD